VFAAIAPRQDLPADLTDPVDVMSREQTQRTLKTVSITQHRGDEVKPLHDKQRVQKADEYFVVALTKRHIVPKQIED
jgi:hypothetical protein